MDAEDRIAVDTTAGSQKSTNDEFSLQDFEIVLQLPIA
jgi:hypothetical protein